MRLDDRIDDRPLLRHWLQLRVTCKRGTCRWVDRLQLEVTAAAATDAVVKTGSGDETGTSRREGDGSRTPTRTASGDAADTMTTARH